MNWWVIIMAATVRKSFLGHLPPIAADANALGR
jgi:hypothetical protein